MDVIGDVNQTKFWLLAIEVPTSWRNMDDLVVTVASLFSPRSSNPGLGPQTASFCPNLMLDLRHRGICCQAFTTPKDLKKTIYSFWSYSQLFSFSKRHRFEEGKFRFVKYSQPEWKATGGCVWSSHRSASVNSLFKRFFPSASAKFTDQIVTEM